MARNSYQIWTSDMVIGAAIAIIGAVATLVRLNLLQVQWTMNLPPLVTHLWPLLLIGTGIVLLTGRDEHAMRERNYLKGGERQ